MTAFDYDERSMKALGTSLTSLPEEEDSIFCDSEGSEGAKILSQEEENDEQETIAGVLFGRSVRAHYASLDLVVLDEEDAKDSYHVMVRIQFQATEVSNEIQQLRSYMRRYYKYGDLIHVSRGTFRSVGIQTEYQQERFVVDVHSVDEAEQVLQLRQVKYMSQSQWQEWQNRVYRRQQQTNKKKKPKSANTTNTSTEENCKAHHSGGLEKRQQGEFVANFLVNMIMNMTAADGATGGLRDPSTWSDSASPSNSRRQDAVDYLNDGTGVLDVAGGSGHVSMALGMLGIQSTVVDPREKVGKLPGRDRKIWNRAVKGKMRKQPSSLPLSTKPPIPPSAAATPLICQPAVEVRPYESLRAWFGAPPQGVDTDFRNPDKATVPVCDAKHSIVQNCRAIVALHPDEATDAIVDVAVERKIPLVIVPCCVFCRLFPRRRMPGENSGTPVSTYEDLLMYLQAKDPSVQKATLPFIGANIVLYSTF